MEIQTFLLAQTIEKVERGISTNYNAANIGLHNFYAKDGKYPIEFNFPYYMLLKRVICENEEVITLRFNLVDIDGRKTGKPNDVCAEGRFPKGHKFMTVSGKIKFLFPRPGDYRLDITADENKFEGIYSYNIEIGKKEDTIY